MPQLRGNEPILGLNRHRRRLIKVVIPDQLLAEWFTKILLP
jgi:hypothetical protein